MTRRLLLPLVLSALQILTGRPALGGQRGADPGPFRPPAVPLVAVDPYFSIWSAADRLTDAPTTHWTKAPHRLTGLVRVDGKTFRVMGDEPATVPPLTQEHLEVLPTRTLYTFAGAGIRLMLIFMTPALPDDLMVFSRPVSYLTWTASSLDGQPHDVRLYFDASPVIAIHEPTQPVTWDHGDKAGVTWLRVGSADQMVLRRKGDGVRIDWGHFYVAATWRPQLSFASAPDSWHQFDRDGSLTPAALTGPRQAAEAPVLAAVFDLGRVAARPVSRWLMLAYDDDYSIQYFESNLRPYWRRNGATTADLLALAARDYDALSARAGGFDTELVGDLRRAGGEKFARMAALAYRQVIAGNKLAADANGQPLLFPKENTSNGCIGTVDVIYPMAPLFLLLGPSLTKAMIVSNLDYAASPRWPFPFAPHDLGTYPQANGQAYGGGEKTEEDQMPVEETGNMLILVTALARVEGASFAGRYWPLLVKWAEYLKAKGYDPDNQLCTDDFAGHLAHNVNLSAKAIIALGAFGRLAEMRGEPALANEYNALARSFAARWVKEADAGDHFRLAFDRPDTWSQKYNLVWDRLLGLNLFPDEVLSKEMAFYRRTLDRFGLPLDNRKAYAKIDWTVWTATLTGSQDDFEALVAPAYEYLHTTPDRVPINDLYWTGTGREVGMHARPVVGAFFIKLLGDRETWRKWATRDRTRASGWAPLPTKQSPDTR